MVKKSANEKRVVRWSYSAWSQFHKCAFAFYRKFVCGDKDTSTSYALERGITLHKQQENYLRGEITGLPRTFLPFKREYIALKKQQPIVEKFWGVDHTWKSVQYGSWVVFKMDAAVPPNKRIGMDSLWIQDLKTGREYDTHAKQASLGAVIGARQYPDIAQVEVEFWYIDQGIIRQYHFDKAELTEEQEFWTEEGERLLTPQKKYLPNPSEENCKYCFLRSDKGGPCDAWKKIKQARKGR